MATVLIIDDESTFVKNVAKFLSTTGHEVFTAETAADGLLLLDKAPDLIVVDYRLPDLDGVSLIQKIREKDVSVPILMITGHGSIELAVEAMKAGASDLMTKPVSLGDLRRRLLDLLQRQRDTSRLKYFDAKERSSMQAIVGDSQVIVELRQRIARIAELVSDGSLPPVLIVGETGTGKELVARACHFESPRASKPFIEINCAAIPGNLLESELFGHEKGAFTDAKERKIGLVEAADEGTLFLDELGEMDLGLQAKLLKVLEDGRFRRVGSIQERQVNIRILAATNLDLEAKIKAGAFRADLYFRLRVLQVAVPPLRERQDDSLLLAKHFLKEFSRRYQRAGSYFSAMAERAIVAHRWPGNVRELRNVVEQAVLLSSSNEIGPQDLLLPNRQPTLVIEPEDAQFNGEDGSMLDHLEREMLIKALQAASNNVSKAARNLGISRDTLRYRMDKHGLRP
jgi:two-component system, NtrC family, response regulator AtoC